MKPTLLPILSLFLFGVLSVQTPSAMDLEIRPFDFVTRGRMVDDRFELQTFGDLGLTLSSGFIARPSVTFGLESDEFGDPEEVQLTIRAVSVEVRELLDSQFSATYFLGESDRLGSGAAFPERFGTDPVATEFRGFLYFPDGPRYEGMHGVSGTGTALQSNDQWDQVEIGTWLYQDNRFDPGVFSTDFRALFNFDRVQLEAFAGATFPYADFGRYRAGLLAHLLAAEDDSLLVQVALPAIEPGDDFDVGVEDFFFLFEPRVRVGALRTTLTFFWQPEIYDQVATERGGSIDTNLRLQFGDIRSNGAAGGLEARLGVSPTGDDQIRVQTEPFVQFDGGGVIWDFRTRLTLVPFDTERLFEAFLGVRTEY